MTPNWKKFENKVQRHFEQRAENERLVYHRFYDTASAVGFLPAQPGDHLVIWQGTPILIETKYSKRFASLSSCFSEMVGDGQIGSHRIWLRAGAQTLFAFQGTDGYELWWGAHLAECRVAKKRLDKEGRLKQCGTLTDLLTNVVIQTNPHYKTYLLTRG